MSSKRTEKAKGTFSRFVDRTEDREFEVSSESEGRRLFGRLSSDRRRTAPNELGDDRRSCGQGERRGRSTDVDRGTRRSPTMQPPTQDWRPDRGRFAARSESVASRSEAGRDAPSGSRKRRNESTHDQERGSKAMKLYDSSSQRRFESMWSSGGLELQKGKMDAITGIKKLGGGQEKPNMVSQFIGQMYDAVAAKTTGGYGKDAETAVLGAHKLAQDRSATKEVLSLHIPIHRADPTASTDYGRDAQAPKSDLPRFRLTQKSKRNPWNSSRTSSPAPWVRSNVPRDKGKKDKDKEDTEGNEDRVTEVVDDPTTTPEVRSTEMNLSDLTLVDEQTTCDICHKTKSHTTGRCSLVSSVAHGDTNTDPFCNVSSSHPRIGAARDIHPLQGTQKGEFRIGCPVLGTFWDHGNWKIVFGKLVVDRRRMPPLAVTTEEFCFLHLTLSFSMHYYKGEMPPELEGIWPYTKADAVKYRKQCEQFWEIGMEKMPRGELEGLTMAEIRQAYHKGEISPQLRYESKEMKQSALLPATITRITDADGDITMRDSASSRLPKKAGTKLRTGKVDDNLEESELIAEAQEEERAALRFSRSIKKIRSKPRMQNAIAALGSDRDEEQAAGGPGKKSLRSRMQRTIDDLVSDKDSTNTEEEQATIPPKVPTQEVIPDHPSTAPASAPEAGQEKPSQELSGDTPMPEAEDDIGIIRKPSDIPEAMLKALETEYDEANLDEKADLLELYMTVRDAGLCEAKLATQTQVHNHLLGLYKDNKLSLVLREAWEKSRGDWIDNRL